ncbi:Uncharacterized protein ChrSV_0012 [Chromobacterium vaccinii]|nr:Uncharacterized protein ChrSW_0012 [Chromobacterium vaccinii]QND87471.1 Uncharacterized protein ChrSV_0012 [Chromobacterium vaccinii]
MGRVVCSRWQSCEIRFKPEGDVCTFFWLDASAACPEQPSVTNSQARRLGLVAEYSPVRHHDKLGRVRLAGSPVCHAISRFNTHCLKCCGMGSPRRATPSPHLVTLALHARNAKKIFTEPHSAKSIFSRLIACNVVKNASIFPKTTQISCAGYRSIDRLMLSKIRTSYFPSSPSAASVIACARTRGQSVLPCQSSRGGVS